MGTGSKIIQGIAIGKNAVIGAGAVVVRQIPSDCVAMGIPAKPVKILGGGYGKLLIVGNSGHGRVIRDLASRIDYYQSMQFVDDDLRQQESRYVIGGSEDVFNYKDEYDVFVAIGNANIRRCLQEKYESGGVSMVSFIHPEAMLSDELPQMGTGTVIMAGAVIQTGVVLGKGVIINTSASVDHDCQFGDYVHIAVGAHLAGNVKVGNDT